MRRRVMYYFQVNRSKVKVTWDIQFFVVGGGGWGGVGGGGGGWGVGGGCIKYIQEKCIPCGEKFHTVMIGK